MPRRHPACSSVAAVAALLLLLPGAALPGGEPPSRELLLPRREFGYGRATFANGLLAAAYYTDLRLGFLPPESVHVTVLAANGGTLLDRGLREDVPEASGVDVVDLAVASRPSRASRPTCRTRSSAPTATRSSSSTVSLRGWSGSGSPGTSEGRARNRTGVSGLREHLRP